MKFDVHKSGGFIGMAGLAAALFMYGAAGSVVPWWVVTLLVLFWLVLFVLGCVWFIRRPVRVFTLPFIAVAVWLTVLLGGDALWGWA